MFHAIELLFDTDDLLHDFDAFIVLTIFGEYLALCVELG
jgi:hypothetical protein